MREEWRARLQSEPMGDDSRSYNAPVSYSDISPLDEEIHVFPTLGTFLWYLGTRVFYTATEYPTKYLSLIHI